MGGQTPPLHKAIGLDVGINEKTMTIIAIVIVFIMLWSSAVY
jgi:hypothetical protein